MPVFYQPSAKDSGLLGTPEAQRKLASHDGNCFINLIKLFTHEIFPNPVCESTAPLTSLHPSAPTANQTNACPSPTTTRTNFDGPRRQLEVRGDHQKPAFSATGGQMTTENQGKERVDGRTRSADGDHITPQPPHQSTTPLERPASRLSALLLAHSLTFCRITAACRNRPISPQIRPARAPPR
eukprot:SAG11_NODE_5755_length_1470_cov_12.811816_1_plen_183_part_00